MEFAVPCVICLIVVYGFVKKIAVFDVFLEGAKKGLYTIYEITPTLIGIVVAISMLRTSGAIEGFCKLISPVTDYLGIPSEIIPLAILRPISGGGSTGLLSNILTENGPDSFVGRVASVMAGSTETTFYVVAVYYGSVKVKKIRHTLIAGLTSDFAAAIMSIITVRMIMY